MAEVRARLLLGAIVTLALAGCSSNEYLSLAGDELANAPCAVTEIIRVESLADRPADACNPIGSSLEFPDGQLLEIGDGSGSSSTVSEWSYSFVNVGALGIVAARYRENCTVLESWGSADALEKAIDAFGESFGAC